MSQTLVNSRSAGARVLAMSSSTSTGDMISTLAGTPDSGCVAASALAKSSATFDLLSTLRDHFVFDDFSAIQGWLSRYTKLYGSLFEASVQIDLIFGAGRTKWLTLTEDWEGTCVLAIEVAFGGSGEDASRLCRKFVALWLVGQPREIRQSLVLGVRFV